MDLRSRFVAALRASGASAVGEVTPSQMSAAAVDVLGVSGAGLVMRQDLVRWPVGASGEAARRAEQVQATLNEGPCLTSAAEGRVLAANETDLEHGWPIYFRELRRRTPFRATISFPVWPVSGSVQDRPFAALNLYSLHPEWRLEEELSTIADEIVELMAVLLVLARPDGPQLDDPVSSIAWQQDRERVYVCVGMVMEAGGMTEVDAIAVLRGYAFARDLLLDDLAEQLMSGRLTTEVVLGSDPT